MLLNEIVECVDNVETTLTLPFDVRQKSRLKTTLDNGSSVSLLLPRGSVLRNGDVLRSELGVLVKVLAAQEEVSIVVSDDKLALMRLCYHLGNRHVPLQIADGFVRYQKDHVIDDLVQRLGMAVSHEQSSFEPEAGAYSH